MMTNHQRTRWEYIMSALVSSPQRQQGDRIRDLEPSMRFLQATSSAIDSWVTVEQNKSNFEPCNILEFIKKWRFKSACLFCCQWSLWLALFSLAAPFSRTFTDKPLKIQKIWDHPGTDQTNLFGDLSELSNSALIFCDGPPVVTCRPKTPRVEARFRLSCLADVPVRQSCPITTLRPCSLRWARAAPAQTPGGNRVWRCGRKWCTKASEAKRPWRNASIPKTWPNRAVPQCPSHR